MLSNQPTTVRSRCTGVGRESCVQKQTRMEGLDAKGGRAKRGRDNSRSIGTGRGICPLGRKRSADCDGWQLRGNGSLIRGNGSNRRLNWSSAQTSRALTAQATILKLMITGFDHDTGIPVLRNPVWVMHVMDM